MVDGEQSFCKRIRYQASAKQDLLDIPNEPDSEDAWNAFLDLGGAPTRWTQKSGQMSTLCLKIIRVFKLIAAWSRDPDVNHRARRQWATRVMHVIQGRSGAELTIQFGVDAEYMTMCSKLVQVQDKDERDIALHEDECMAYSEISSALFRDGRLFQEECVGTYTHAILWALKQEPEFHFGKQEVATLGWPSTHKACQRAIFHARNLHDLTQQFLETNFPGYAWRRPMKAFDSSDSALPEAMRLQHFERLGKKEGLEASQVRYQMGAIMHTLKPMFKEYGSNVMVWKTVAEQCKVPGCQYFRQDMNCVVVLSLLILGQLDTSTAVERNLRDVEFAQSLARSAHLGVLALRDCVKA